MSKHTPGPWTVIINEEDKYHLGGGFNLVKVAENRYLQMEGLSEEQANYNAYLTAAAPELLEALETIIQGHDTDIKIGERPAVLTRDIHKARKAIAKAKGEE